MLSPSPSIPIPLRHCLPPQGSPQALRSLPWKKPAQNSYFYGNNEAASGFRAVLEVTFPTSQGDEVPTLHLPPVRPKPQPPEPAVPACSSPRFLTPPPPPHLERGEAVQHQEPAGLEQCRALLLVLFSPWQMHYSEIPTLLRVFMSTSSLFPTRSYELLLTLQT